MKPTEEQIRAMSRAIDRADEQERLMVAVKNLVEIVEGVRNERWAANGVRLKDTPEWCALYSAWSKQGALNQA